MDFTMMSPKTDKYLNVDLKNSSVCFCSHTKVLQYEVTWKDKKKKILHMLKVRGPS